MFAISASETGEAVAYDGLVVVVVVVVVVGDGVGSIAVDVVVIEVGSRFVMHVAVVAVDEVVIMVLAIVASRIHYSAAATSCLAMNEGIVHCC